MTTKQLLDRPAEPASMLDPPPAPTDLAGLSAHDWEGWEDGAYVLAYLARIGMA